MAVISEAYIRKFDSAIRVLSQQETSTLRGAVDFEDLKAEQALLELLDVSALQDVPSRHSDTPISDPNHTRRRITASRKVGSHMVDTADQLRTLIEPTSRYARNLVMAANRVIDQSIIDAFDADVFTGKDGTTSVTFASDGTNTIDNAFGGTATIGMTVAKLIEVKRIFRANNVKGEMHIVVSAEQEADLLKTTEFRSFDYRNSKALEQGDIGQGFMGFLWHVMGESTTNGAALPLNRAGTDFRDCFAWVKDGMVLGMTQDVTTSVDKIPIKQNSILVQTHVDVGAVRLEGPKVIRIECDESP